jgi:hypothetical protein
MTDIALDCYRELVFTDFDRKAAIRRWFREQVENNVPPWLMKRIHAVRETQMKMISP